MKRALLFTRSWFPFRPLAVCLAAGVLAWISIPEARAVLVQSGAPNDSGPVVPVDDPGFANIGRSSTGGASVTYLGNRWILTVNHATIGNNFGKITFGSFASDVVDGSKVQLVNSDSTVADLALWRLVDDPGLPALDISSTSATTETPVTLIGNGRTIGPRLPTNSGYTVDRSSFVIRWGTNVVDSVGGFETVGFGKNHTFHTVFDDEGSSSTEAQVSRGDSGGGVFRRTDGLWELAGIIFANSTFDNQPTSGPPTFEPLTALFGNESVAADLSFYRNQIVALVGERVVGDVNGNSVVDFADLGILLNHFEQPGNLAAGDFDGSGFVDFVDLGMLLNNYTSPPPTLPPAVNLAASAAVPEPGTLVLAALAAGCATLFSARFILNKRFAPRRQA